MAEIENWRELETFAHNITWLRKHYGISKKRMSFLLGISVRSLNRIENGDVPLGLRVNIFFNVYKHFGILPNQQLGQRFGE